MRRSTLFAQINDIRRTWIQTFDGDGILGHTDERILCRSSACQCICIRQRVTFLRRVGKDSRRSRRSYQCETFRFETVRNRIHYEVIEVCTTIITGRNCIHLDGDILTCTSIRIEVHRVRLIVGRCRRVGSQRYESSRIGRISHDTNCKSSIIIVISRSIAVSSCIEAQTQCVQAFHFRKNRILILRIRVRICIELKRVLAGVSIGGTLIYYRIIVVIRIRARIDHIPTERQFIFYVIKVLTPREGSNRLAEGNCADRFSELALRRFIRRVTPSSYHDVIDS